MPPKRENGRASTSSEAIGDWMGERDELVARMRREGTRQPAFGPLLHEFAEALRIAAKLREAAEEELFVKSERSGRSYIHPGIAAADLDVPRAAPLLRRAHAPPTSHTADD